MATQQHEMIYFRRPQTAFVDSEISQKPQSQWKLVAEGKEEEPPSEGSCSSMGLDGVSIMGDGSGSGRHQPILNENGSASLLEEDPVVEDSPKDPLAAHAGEPPQPTDHLHQENSSTIDPDDHELAQSLERRLQLEVKHHPESVLLCGYFHEEVMDDCLTLSTYLPGVQARELRVYYGEGVLKIAGARALYNVVQRFERSFAIDEQLVDTTKIAAILHDGMLLVRVPLVPMPPPPRKITVVSASPLILFKDRRDLFCLDIDVPGVQRKDLTVYYSNGLLRLLWERMEPMPTTELSVQPQTSTALNTSSLRQMRFEKEIPINTLQIDTEKLTAYLDHHSKSTGVLSIVAPIKLKRTARPIQVQTAKDLQDLESSGSK